MRERIVMIGLALLIALFFHGTAHAGVKEKGPLFKKVDPPASGNTPSAYEEGVVVPEKVKPVGVPPVGAAKKKPIFTAEDPFVVKSGILNRMYLYDHSVGDSKLVKNEVLYNRVYVRFNAELDEWVFMLSDARGYFANPPEVLMVGSVLPGYRIGSDNPTQNYVFEPGGKWVPTKDPEMHKLVVLSNPPRRLDRYFEAPEKYQIEYPDRRQIVDVRKFYPEVIRYAEP